MSLYTLLGALIGLLFCTVIAHLMTAPRYIMTTEELSEEEVKRITDARANYINNICDAAGDAWDLKPDDFNSNAELLPNEITLVTLIYKNNLIRIYTYWSKNITQITLTRKFEKGSKVYKKSFDFRKKNALENIYIFLEKYRPASDKKAADAKEMIVEKLTTVIENVVEQKVQEKLQKMLADLEEKEDDKDHE